MENLIFSLNMITPLFLLILLGMILKKQGMLTEQFCSAATSLVFYVALPCSLYKSVCSTDVSEAFNLKFVVFLIITQILVFSILWAFVAKVIQDRNQRSAIIHSAFRGNYAYIGMPLLCNILEKENLIASVMVMGFGVTIYNMFAVVILSYYDPSGKKISIKQQIIKVLTNPVMLSICLGLLASMIHFTLPSMINKSVNYLAQLATPLALLLIGATLNVNTFTKKPIGILMATMFKLVIIPLFVTVAAILCGFKGEELVTLYVFFAMPSATNSYIMTKNMNGDGELAAGVVTLTSLLSIVTITIGIFMLKSMSLL